MVTATGAADQAPLELHRGVHGAILAVRPADDGGRPGSDLALWHRAYASPWVGYFTMPWLIWKNSNGVAGEADRPAKADRPEVARHHVGPI